MTNDQANMFRDVVVGFIENEARSTQRVIAAVPNDGREYRPDAKSRSSWEVATHIALSDVWFADGIIGGQFVWTGEPPLPPAFTDPQAVASWYAGEMNQRFAAIRNLKHEDLVRETELFGKKAPAVLWLLMLNNHMVHHRGQLTAHLRAAGGKVPAVYGVSADENLMASKDPVVTT